MPRSLNLKREHSNTGSYLGSMVDVPEINQFHLLNKSVTVLELWQWMLCGTAGPDHRRCKHDAMRDANDVPKVSV